MAGKNGSGKSNLFRTIKQVLAQRTVYHREVPTWDSSKVSSIKLTVKMPTSGLQALNILFPSVSRNGIDHNIKWSEEVEFDFCLDSIVTG